MAVGRPKKMNDATRAYIFSEALAQYYHTGSNMGDKIALITDMLEKGDMKAKMWVAEQLFGRATSTIITIQEGEDAEHEEEVEVHTPVITWSDEKNND